MPKLKQFTWKQIKNQYRPNAPVWDGTWNFPNIVGTCGHMEWYGYIGKRKVATIEFGTYTYTGKIEYYTKFKTIFAAKRYSDKSLTPPDLNALRLTAEKQVQDRILELLETEE